jgi:hypothetical protein
MTAILRFPIAIATVSASSHESSASSKTKVPTSVSYHACYHEFPLHPVMNLTWFAICHVLLTLCVNQGNQNNQENCIVSLHTRRLPKQIIYLVETMISHCKGSTKWLLPLFSLGVWLIKRTAESKLYCKKDFHEIIRQCSCLSHTQKHYITLDLIMHCTYHFSCGLSFRFQISLSLAAMALSYSCHNMNLFWPKAVGLQFISIEMTTTTFKF